MWQNAEAASLESAAPRPRRNPSTMSPAVGGNVHASSSPNEAVSTQASRVHHGPGRPPAISTSSPTS